MDKQILEQIIIDQANEPMQAYELEQGFIITEDEQGTEVIKSEDKEYTINIVPCWKWLLEDSR